jgi:hypothetical protein
MVQSRSKRRLKEFRQASLHRRIAAIVKADREAKVGSFAPQPAPYSILDDLKKLADGR